RHRTRRPRRRRPRRRRGHGPVRDRRRGDGLLLRRDRRRLERHLPAAGDDDHRQRLQADGVLRVPRDLGGAAFGGTPVPADALLVVITAVASAVLDNVTTVLLVAPVTFAVCARLGLPVVPYLIAQVFASNIGGTATLIGDPP